MKKIFTSLDLNQNEVSSLVYENLSYFPSDSIKGRVIFHTGKRNVYVCIRGKEDLVDTSLEENWTSSLEVFNRLMADIMSNSLRIEALSDGMFDSGLSFFVDSFSDESNIDTVASQNYELSGEGFVGPIGTNPQTEKISTLAELQEGNFVDTEAILDLGGDGAVQKEKVIDGSELLLEDFEDTSDIQVATKTYVYEDNFGSTSTWNPSDPLEVYLEQDFSSWGWSINEEDNYIESPVIDFSGQSNLSLDIRIPSLFIGASTYLSVFIYDGSSYHKIKEISSAGIHENIVIQNIYLSATSKLKIQIEGSNPDADGSLSAYIDWVGIYETGVSSLPQETDSTKVYEGTASGIFELNSCNCVDGFTKVFSSLTDITPYKDLYFRFRKQTSQHDYRYKITLKDGDQNTYESDYFENITVDEWEIKTFEVPPNNNLLEDLISYYNCNLNTVDQHGDNNAIREGIGYRTGGIINQGLGGFDGSSDRLVCNGLDICNGQSEFTVSFWYNRVDTSKDFFLGQGYAASNKFQVRLQNTIIRVYVNNGDNSNYVETTFNNTGWSHIIITFDGTRDNENRIKIYVNGEEQTLSINGTQPTNNANNDYTFYFGYIENTNQYADDCIIDEMGIWDRHLDVYDVSALYNEGNAISYNNFQSGIESYIEPTYLLTNIDDEFVKDGGKILASLYFDYEIGDSGVLFEVGATGTGASVIIYNSNLYVNHGDGDPYGNANQFELVIPSVNQYLSTTEENRIDVLIGNGATVYINKELIDSESSTISDIAGGNPGGFGRIHDSICGNIAGWTTDPDGRYTNTIRKCLVYDNFTGDIEDIDRFNPEILKKIQVTFDDPYKDILQSSVGTDDTTSPSLISDVNNYFQLNGDSESILGDNILNNSNVTYDTGKFNQSAVFNGSSSYLYGDLDMNTYDSIGINFWYNTVQASSARGYVLSIEDATFDNGIFLRISDANDFRISIGGSHQLTNLGTSPPNDGTWHMITANYDATTGLMELYLDNVLVDSDTRGVPIDMNLPNLDTYIGSRNDGGSSYVGKLDDVIIHSSPITSAQRIALWNSGNGKANLTGNLIPIKSKSILDFNPTSYLKLDGDVIDSVDTGKTHTNNGVTFTTGQIGQASIHDGGNPSDIEIDNDLSGLEKFTMSFWTYRDNTSDRIDISQMESNNENGFKWLRHDNGYIYAMVRNNDTNYTSVL